MGLFQRYTDYLRDEFDFVHGNYLVFLTAGIISGAVANLYSAFRSQYFIALGASPYILGLLGSLTSAITVIIQIPGGYIADKSGRKNILTFFTFTAALGFLVYGIAPDWRYIVLAVSIVNLSRIYRPAQGALHADSIPREKRGIGFSLLRTGTSVAGSFSPLLGGYIVEQMGLVPGVRLSYYVTTFAMGLIGLMSWIFLKETISTPESLDVKQFLQSFIKSYTMLRETLGLIEGPLKVLVLFLVLSTAVSPIFSFAPLYVTDVIGISYLRWGLLTTIYTVTSVLLSLPAGKIVDLIGRKKSLLIAFALYSLSYFFLPFSSSFYHVLLFQIATAVGDSFTYPSVYSLQADFTTPEIRGRVLGMLTVLRNIAVIPSSAFIGFLYGVNPKYSFLVVAGMEVVVLLIIFFFLQEPRRIDV